MLVHPMARHPTKICAHPFGHLGALFRSAQEGVEVAVGELLAATCGHPPALNKGVPVESRKPAVQMNPTEYNVNPSHTLRQQPPHRGHSSMTAGKLVALHVMGNLVHVSVMWVRVYLYV